MRAFYNDNEAYCVRWLENLAAKGLIAAGDVDGRPIQELTPGELDGYRQCHFFAGIGGWSYALRLAGWPDDAEVWTGSCPCQPFSCAGRGRAEEDERHLWPAFRRLVSERRPSVVFGEQVASKAGREWLAGVRADLEDLGYRVGAADLCAAGVGAPHIRQRLFWVADYSGDGLEGGGIKVSGRGDAGVQSNGSCGLGDSCPSCGMADAARGGRDAGIGHRAEAGHELDAKGSCENGGMAYAESSGFKARRSDWMGIGEQEAGLSTARSSGTNWIPCADGKARRIESGLEPLAHGIPGRVGRLRAYGNAIVPQVAAEFIRAYMETQ